MATEPTECPNCGTKLKEGYLSSVALLSQDKVQIINEYHEPKAAGYCNKCGTDLYSTYKTKLQVELDQLFHKVRKLIGAVPVVSTHSPLNWDYDVIGMVTGQSTTGTGVISELTSSFTDFFGTQSGRFNRKLKDGEDLCFAQLRKQALESGGNAVIAASVNHSEVGGGKGMLMVCMAGTAIRLKNASILGKDRAENIEELARLNDRMNLLNSYRDSGNEY